MDSIAAAAQCQALSQIRFIKCSYSRKQHSTQCSDSLRSDNLCDIRLARGFLQPLTWRRQVSRSVKKFVKYESSNRAALRKQQRGIFWIRAASEQSVANDTYDSQREEYGAEGDVEIEDSSAGRLRAVSTQLVEVAAVAGGISKSVSNQFVPRKEYLSMAAEVPKETSVDLKVGPGCFVDRKPQNKQVYLFYCSETAELARKIAAESDNIVLRTVNWGLFADGFPDLFIVDAHDIRSCHVAFLASFSSPAVIFEQLSIIYALPRMFVASFTLVLPFFPTGTSERIEDEGDIATAFTLARIVSNIPMSRGGPTSVVIFDIHALQERFYFGDSVLPYFESGIPLLKQQLQQLPDADNVSIAYPDEGAWKRFYKQLQDFPTIVCTKVRDGSKRIVKLKEGEPAGRHIVIVDDLVQSGGTLLECQKVLSALGAKRVSAYATHGVFPKRSWARFVHDHGAGPEHGLAHFWITDSCPLTVQQVHGRPPFEILSLASPIAAALQI